MKTNIKIILGMILLFSIFWSILPLITAVECIGQGCAMNMSLNVVNVSAIPLPRFSLTGQAIYSVLESAGAGIGSFLLMMGQSLPYLLIGLMMIAIIVAIAYSIFKSLDLWKEARKEYN